MMFKQRQQKLKTNLPATQKGALTMFSAVMILILLTAMVIYAAQVGVFEQRKSGNELRQKQAFHSAEVGIQRGQEYLLAYVLDLTSTNTTTGWLSETHMSSLGGSGRWIECAGNYSRSDGPHDFWHPCYGEGLDGDSGEPNIRNLSMFYSEDGTNPTPLPIPIADADPLMDRAEEASEVYALLCMLDVQQAAPQPVQGCLDPASQRNEFDPVYFIVTLLSRGRSECDADTGVCRGEALVAQRIGSYGPVPQGSGPGVPLTARTSLRAGGTPEIVANPNGGGVGVPVSVWIDGNPETGVSTCNPGAPAVDPTSNSWATCEMHEWYGVDASAVPEDLRCEGVCECTQDEKRLSFGNRDNGLSYDIVMDPLFPCDDFFNVIFGTDVLSEAKSKFTVIDSCDELGPTSRGPIWVSSSVDCVFGGGITVGSHTDPVFLVSAAPELRIGGGSTIYGVVVTTDKEDQAGLFNGSGGGTVFGAVMVDGLLDPQYGSNFEIVWNDDLVRLATSRGSLGKLYGGWTDIHEDWR